MASSTIASPVPAAAPIAAEGTSNPPAGDGLSTTGSDCVDAVSAERKSWYASAAGAAIEDGGGGTLGESLAPPAAPGMYCSTGRAEAAGAPIELAIAAAASAAATAFLVAMEGISTPWFETAGCGRSMGACTGPVIARSRRAHRR
jgi:hypothetical protein